jgi:hypothetical protein
MLCLVSTYAIYLIWVEQGYHLKHGLISSLQHAEVIVVPKAYIGNFLESSRPSVLIWPRPRHLFSLTPL